MAAALELQTHVSDADLLDRFVAVLLDRGVVDHQVLERGRKVSEASGERLDWVLNKLGLVSDDVLVETWLDICELDALRVHDFPEQKIEIEGLEKSFLQFSRVIPVCLSGQDLTVAVVDPLNVASILAIEAKTGYRVERKLVRPVDFSAAFLRLYGTDQPDRTAFLHHDDRASDDVERIRETSSDAPIIRIVTSLIERAIELKASDIHVTATRIGTRIRYRVDGALRETASPPSGLHTSIISRLKIMAGIDIAEQRLPQDGRIKTAWRGREIDLRVATMPHSLGEGMVLRVLDRSTNVLDFNRLGISTNVVSYLKSVLSQPNGLFLMTGPTGSGKSTTLYAALQSIARPDRNIVTIEDPIELQIDGVTQIQTHRSIGLDFADILRAVLRQDPDVIMVGEIRDQDTAQVANRAALTGHFVLATIHTNTAPAALPRLIDMGIEPFLLASTIRGVMAQRLVRKLCERCRVEVPAGNGSTEGAHKAFKAVGCEVCHGTGYSGRVAICEFLPINEHIRELILSRSSEADLAEAGARSGMVTLSCDAAEKIGAGLTSADEVIRVIGI